MASERDENGRFVKGHSLGKRFKKGETSLNKGRRYKCKSYNLTEKGKEQKIKNLGSYAKRLNRKSINKKGYVISYLGNSRTGREHISVWLRANHLHRLPDNCCIHHLDLNKTNNKIENLQLMPMSDHTSFHRQLQIGGLKLQ